MKGREAFFEQSENVDVSFDVVGNNFTHIIFPSFFLFGLSFSTRLSLKHVRGGKKEKKKKGKKEKRKTYFRHFAAF